jgi:putative PIN family toxin of toxin-antitoxin system
MMTTMSLTPESRYVFDTNVLISALLFSQSTPRRAFDAAQDHGKILVSQPLMQELLRVARRPKFERYVTQAEREQFLVALTQMATLVTVTVEFDVVRDSKDNLILELAVRGHASAFISGDSDLLTLGSYDSIPIQTPVQFLQLLAPTPPDPTPPDEPAP